MQDSRHPTGTSSKGSQTDPNARARMLAKVDTFKERYCKDSANLEFARRLRRRVLDGEFETFAAFAHACPAIMKMTDTEIASAGTNFGRAKMVDRKPTPMSTTTLFPDPVAERAKRDNAVVTHSWVSPHSS